MADQSTQSVPVALPEPTPAPPEGPPRKPFPWPLATLVAGSVVLLVAGAAAYRQGLQSLEGLQRADQRIAETAERQQQLQAEIDAVRSALDAQRRELDAQAVAVAAQQREAQAQQQVLARQQLGVETERERLRQKAADLTESVAAVHRRLGRDATGWMAAEADYLMQVAAQRLTVFRDPAAAAEALRLADRRLLETGDPGWSSVRELLAEEIAALSALRPPDVAALAAELWLLGEQAAALRTPVAGRAASSGTALADEGDESAWRRVLRDGWEGFRSLVVIRRHDQPVAALLPPEQSVYLTHHLRLEIEAARLALLRADPALYRASLANAASLLATWFDPADPAVASLAQSLGRLGSVDVRPALPDITPALRALRAREQRNPAAEAPATP
ncbi:MAG: uroporphyrinogen-III C-methyltransferase [Gammaproteobacteria bacterium]|nr:uroporphyrinogen-III C-methyltransferase [Gammaproteobacteria bacterium]